MLAEPGDQRRLLELAEEDADIARLTHQARSLPQHKRIQDLMKARADATDALVEARTVVGDLEAATARAESDLVPVRERLQRNQARIEDGSISDGKVLRGLMEEVEHLRRRISDLEDAELDLMGELEAAQEGQERVAEQKSRIEEQLRADVAERDEQVAALAAEAKQVQVTRDARAKSLSADLLALYEKLRASKGTGAALLQRGHCTGCQLEIPVSDLDGYRKAPVNQVLRCAHCDRILIRTETSGL